VAVLVGSAASPVPTRAANGDPGVVKLRPSAVVKHAPVRVVVRPPAVARRLRVHLRSRDVTARFRRIGGSRLVGTLTRNSLVGIRQVINSDYGRLKALGSVASSRDWTVVDTDLVERLRNASRGSFSSELMPVAYGVHSLQKRSTSWELTEADGISCRSFGAAESWVGTPTRCRSPGWVTSSATATRAGGQRAWPSASIL
jgi:hypothetical protein